jgi:hypothetical protein
LKVWISRGSHEREKRGELFISFDDYDDDTDIDGYSIESIVKFL